MHQVVESDCKLEGPKMPTQVDDGGKLLGQVSSSAIMTYMLQRTK